MTVNGAAASLTPGGAFAADVDLAEGENTLTVVARDRVGNETTETRTVRYFAYDTAWQVAGDRGTGALLAFLTITDAAGDSVQVDTVLAALVAADGSVAVSEPMRWEQKDERYHANLGRPADGSYTLRAEAVVEGWNVALGGPVVVRGRTAAPTPIVPKHARPRARRGVGCARRLRSCARILPGNS